MEVYYFIIFMYNFFFHIKEYNCSNPSENIILLPGTIGCQVNSLVSVVFASQECFRGDQAK